MTRDDAIRARCECCEHMLGMCAEPFFARCQAWTPRDDDVRDAVRVSESKGEILSRMDEIEKRAKHDRDEANRQLVNLADRVEAFDANAVAQIFEIVGRVSKQRVRLRVLEMRLARLFKEGKA
uniref:Uncharacterized protein n=1 Tax=viral metagenome TaxID=1070528 RepID=A0A6M3XUZ6_9ZZZZ